MFNKTNNNTGLSGLEAFLAGAALAPSNKLEDGVYTGTVQTFENGQDSNGTHCIILNIKVPNMANNIRMNVYDLEELKLELKLAYNYNINVTRDLMFKQVSIYVLDGRRSFSPLLPVGVHQTKFVGFHAVNDKVSFSVELDGTIYHYIRRIDRTSTERRLKTTQSITITLQHLIGQLYNRPATPQDIANAKGKDVTVWVTKSEEYKSAFWAFREPTAPKVSTSKDEAAVTEIQY